MGLQCTLARGREREVRMVQPSPSWLGELSGRLISEKRGGGGIVGGCVGRNIVTLLRIAVQVSKHTITPLKVPIVQRKLTRNQK